MLHKNKACLSGRVLLLLGCGLDLFLTKQPHLVAFERLFDDFDDPVDLLDADDGKASDVFGVGLALRHAPGHHHLLPVGQASVDLVPKVVLGWGLDCARVEDPNVSIASVISDSTISEQKKGDKLGKQCFVSIIT